MEQGIVENTSAEIVEVMWDGVQVVFKPGQKKMFVKSVAQHIANENEALSFVEDEVVAVKAEVSDEVETPVAKILKCKKCNFETDNKGALLQHYNKEHKNK